MSLTIAALALTAILSAATARVDAVQVSGANAVRVSGELSEEVW